MKPSSFSRWLSAAAVLLLIGGVAASCGDDSDTNSQDDSSSGSGGNAATTVGSGGSGAQGGSASSTGGSGPTGVICDLDSRCSNKEHCACHDCWPEGKCNTSAECITDGVCGPKEGCFCADCKDEPECTGYCISCQQYTTTFADVGALCTDGAPSSVDFWQSLRTCACDTFCATECTNLCNGFGFSAECNDCVEMNCEADRDACTADIKPFVLCNPVTGEPCNTAGTERCDRLEVAGVQIGFACSLKTASSSVCEACEYTFGSSTYCRTGNTCVNASGSPVTTGTCGRYCCEDADCGAGGVCQKGAFDATPDLGVCAATDCTPPADPPSMGACVTLTPVP